MEEYRDLNGQITRIKARVCRLEKNNRWMKFWLGSGLFLSATVFLTRWLDAKQNRTSATDAVQNQTVQAVLGEN